MGSRKSIMGAVVDPGGTIAPALGEEKKKYWEFLGVANFLKGTVGEEFVDSLMARVCIWKFSVSLSLSN